MAFMAPPMNLLRAAACSMAGESPALLHHADRALSPRESCAAFRDEKKQKRFLPASLAAYIAASACLPSVAASAASSGNRLMPMLADTRASAPPGSAYGRSASPSSLLTM